MFIYYDRAFEAVTGRIGSAWKKLRELGGVLLGKQSLSLKQRGKIYQSYVRLVLLHCSKTWELTVADELTLRKVQQRMIRTMCWVKLVDRISSDVLRERLCVAVKMEDILVPSRLESYEIVQ